MLIDLVNRVPTLKDDLSRQQLLEQLEHEGSRLRVELHDKIEQAEQIGLVVNPNNPMYKQAAGMSSSKSPLSGLPTPVGILIIMIMIDYLHH